MRRIFGKKEGFTLLELLIVVVVLAVLAGLALPQYLRTVGRSKESEGWQTLAAIRSAIIRYYSEDEILPTDSTPAELDIDDPSTPVNRVFNYTWVGGANGTFTITADPSGPGASTGVRTLTLNEVGARTSVP